MSESLLNAMSLPELVGSNPDDMVCIARRIGTDAAYREALRQKVSANRYISPLFDTARFTRDFETAIRLMVQRHRSGQSPDHIDVPDEGPVDAARPAPAFTGRVAALQVAYTGCPLCNTPSTSLGFADCTGHARWHEPPAAHTGMDALYRLWTYPHASLLEPGGDQRNPLQGQRRAIGRTCTG